MADVDAGLEQEILDLPQRQRRAAVRQRREADHLGRAVEIAQGVLHPSTLQATRVSLKPGWSDNATDRDAALIPAY